MQQNEDHDNDFGGQTSGLSQDKAAKIRDWRNEHGQPDFAFLQSLVKAGTIESLEKLKSIAEDLDITLDPNSSPEDLVDRIRSTVAQNGNGNPRATT